ncbi:MAG TPA: outer membrane beta-barrel protein [Chitinophagaceae bacterium]|nr:outer membrane beta-barrel protein [Chitinophagaceae bacterium]
MNGDLQHIDDLFKSGLEGKEETPSPAVWVNVEKELDKKDSRPKFFYWWNTRKIAAAFLIVLGSAGLFAGGYYLGIRKEDKVETRDKKPNSSPASNTMTSDEQSATSFANTENNSGTQAGNETKNSNTPAENIVGKNNDAAEENFDRQVRIDLAKKQSGNAAQGAAISGVTTTDETKKSTSKDFTTRSGNTPPSVTQLNEVNTSRAGGGKYNTSNTPAGSKSGQPVATSEKSVAGTQDQTGESLLSSGGPRVWEPERIAEGSSSIGLPEVEKQIPVQKKTRSAAAGTRPAEAATSIPVLNKRSSAVDLPRFSLTPVAGFQFGSNKIVANNDPHANSVKTDIDRTESQPMSINGGVLADLKIARNMTLQSGIVFTSRTIEIAPKYIKAERNPDGKVRYKFDCSAGTYFIKKSTYARPGDSAMTIFSTNELNYINIPLALTYHFGGEKFSFFATAGAGMNLLTDQYLETGLSNYNYDEEESVATNLKSSYFNGTIGAGVNYRPFKKVSFLFSPQYQFAVSPMNENMPVKAYPKIFNLQLGMQIRL